MERCANLYLTPLFHEAATLWAKSKRWGIPYGDWWRAPHLWVDVVTAFDAEADYLDKLEMESHRAGE